VTNLTAVLPAPAIPVVPTRLVLPRCARVLGGWLGDAADIHVVELERRAEGRDELALVSPFPNRTNRGRRRARLAKRQ
jgi:hypothetical protein